MKPEVAIIMGSDSDLPIMQQAADILDQFNIPYILKRSYPHIVLQIVYLILVEMQLKMA